MKKELKEKFPTWCQDGETKYNLILSDDIDSLMCYQYQNWHFGREVKYFFDANTPNWTQTLYKLQDFKGCGNDNVLGLDIALEGNIKTWDNHIVKIRNTDTFNPNSANMNIALNICQNNYTKKACVSSFITMLSYHEEDITKWSKEQLCVLCSIDGLYYPFQNPNFIATGRKNLELLGYEFLEEFIKENMDLILKLEQELNLKNGKIHINENGKMYTDINLDKLNDIFFDLFLGIHLPRETFKETYILKKQYIKDINYSKDYLLKKNEIFNFALNYKSAGVYSYPI